MALLILIFGIGALPCTPIDTFPSISIATVGLLQNRPMTTIGDVGATLQLLAVATIRRTTSNAVVSHYNVRPVIDVYAAVQSRDLARC